MTRPTKLIDADALIPMMKYATTDSEIGVFPIKIGFNAITEVINNASTIDAIPVSFIQELIDRDKQLIEEYGGKQDYEIIVDGLIERVVNYEALIEKWREKNGTDVD